MDIAGGFFMSSITNNDTPRVSFYECVYNTCETTIIPRGAFKNPIDTLELIQLCLVNSCKMTSIRVITNFHQVRQIFRVFFIIIWLFDAAKSEEIFDKHQNNVNNIDKKANSSRIVARHLYLPPEESDFLLPEVIDNKVRSGFLSTIPTRPIIVPSIELKTPFVNENYRYLPPSLKQATATSITAAVQSNDIEVAGIVRINSMSCKNADDGIYFRATVVPTRKTGSPIIEAAGLGDSCKISKINEEYRLDLNGELFWNCGVQDCSTEAGRFYCLNLRFPAVTGLRLKEDVKVLLRCRVQEKITSHTKRINLKTLDTTARMAPKVATGGNKNAFETEVGLYRKTLGSENIFDAKIQPGGTVILGEEILLRVAVREGDGWRYSRMSDVTVHYVENKRRKKIMNSMWILDSNGCLNPGVHEICSREQYRVNPLESYLIFEAFMFDNMSETDEMIMNVKVTGCLDGNDCALNCPSGHVRKSRSLEKHNQTIDWLDDVSFRVVLPKQHDERRAMNTPMMIIPYALSAFILLAIIALLGTIKIVSKQKMRKFEQY